MMKNILNASLLAALVLTGSAFAAEVSKAEVSKAAAPMATATTAVTETSSLTAPAAQIAAPAVPALFQKPVALRGTVGDVQIQVNIRPKEEVDEGHEGEYFIFGNSHKILLAGEIEGGILFMEESVNGTDISGQWDGKLEGDVLAGTWMSADGSITKPFSLKVIPATQTSSKAAKKGVASKQQSH